MNKLNEKELTNIKGGTTGAISGTVINALANIIKMIREAGYDIGSGCRRFFQNEMCPFE